MQAASSTELESRSSPAEGDAHSVYRSFQASLDCVWKAALQIKADIESNVALIRARSTALGSADASAADAELDKVMPFVLYAAGAATDVEEPHAAQADSSSIAASHSEDQAPLEDDMPPPGQRSRLVDATDDAGPRAGTPSSPSPPRKEEDSSALAHARKRKHVSFSSPPDELIASPDSPRSPKRQHASQEEDQHQEAGSEGDDAEREDAHEMQDQHDDDQREPSPADKQFVEGACSTADSGIIVKANVMPSPAATLVCAARVVAELFG